MFAVGRYTRVSCANICSRRPAPRKCAIRGGSNLTKIAIVREGVLPTRGRSIRDNRQISMKKKVHYRSRVMLCAFLDYTAVGIAVRLSVELRNAAEICHASSAGPQSIIVEYVTTNSGISFERVAPNDGKAEQNSGYTSIKRAKCILQLYCLPSSVALLWA